jgi:hypothetical protein
MNITFLTKDKNEYELYQSSPEIDFPSALENTTKRSSKYYHPSQSNTQILSFAKPISQ